MLRHRTIVVRRGLVSVTHDSLERAYKRRLRSAEKKKTIKCGEKNPNGPALFGNFHANSNGFELYTYTTAVVILLLSSLYIQYYYYHMII